MNTSGRNYLVLVAISALLVTKLGGACVYNSDCTAISTEYRRCCYSPVESKFKCSKRRNCDDSCVYNSDCARNENCIYQKCGDINNPVTSRPVGYCENLDSCPAKQWCDLTQKRCVPRTTSCFCSGNEVCRNGRCEPAPGDSSTSFSPVSIAALTAVVVIGSCVACILYCVCGRKRNLPQGEGNRGVDRATQQHSVSQTVAFAPESVHNRGTNPNSDPGSPPLPPNAPPPYLSLDFSEQNQPEPFQSPPTYAEALRNSKNNLNSV